MDEHHMQEAAAVAQLIAGFATYLPAIRYSVDEFQRELDQIVDHMKRQQQGLRADRARRDGVRPSVAARIAPLDLQVF